MLIVALLLVQFHGPTGQRIDVNPAEVISVREPRDRTMLAEGVHCVLGVSNGKFISLRENCDEVRRELEAPCNCGAHP